MKIIIIIKIYDICNTFKKSIHMHTQHDIIEKEDLKNLVYLELPKKEK